MKKRSSREAGKHSELKKIAPLIRAKQEIKSVLKHAERYRIGILKKVATFGK